MTGDRADALRHLLDELRDDAERMLRFNRNLEHRDDLLSELWLVWHDLSGDVGRELDLFDPLDRAVLVAAWRRGIERASGCEYRRGKRLLSADAPLASDGEGACLLDRLPADAASDPLHCLGDLEDRLERLLIRTEIDGTWSQPAGYALLYERAGEQLLELARACGTERATLVGRLQHLMSLHRVQARLFDGLHRLTLDDVAPPRARPRVLRRHGPVMPQALLLRPETSRGVPS